MLSIVPFSGEFKKEKMAGYDGVVCAFLENLTQKTILLTLSVFSLFGLNSLRCHCRQMNKYLPNNVVFIIYIASLVRQLLLNRMLPFIHFIWIKQLCDKLLLQHSVCRARVSVRVITNSDRVRWLVSSRTAVRYYGNYFPCRIDDFHFGDENFFCRPLTRAIFC